ncbi:MAG: hypothetical protein WC071_01870 [Victivallaceae bacterium]
MYKNIKITGSDYAETRGTNAIAITLTKYTRGKNMNKKNRFKAFFILTVIVILLSALTTPFIMRESKQKISLYVNPNFKLDNYNLFYYEDVGGEEVGMDIRTILRDSGLKDGYKSDEKNLYVIVKYTDGFIFPPKLVNHSFEPYFFCTKTLSTEIYDANSHELLLKISFWRGTFNRGGGYLNGTVSLLKQGLHQAGWKEKKGDLIPKPTQ